MDDELMRFLKQATGRMTARWEAFRSGDAAGFAASDAWAAYSLDAIDRVLFRGKTLRGMLVYLGMALTGKETDQAADSLALASELVQLSLLVHDDIMDGDEKRRGLPSLHVAARTAAPFIQPQKTGESIAVCVGDAGFFLAGMLVSRTGHPDIAALMSLEYARVTAAQIHDVTLADLPGMPPREDIIAVYRGKTGRYSVGLPLVIGAILGHAEPAVTDGLWAFSEHAGIAFQLRDDWLNLFGDPETTGKPVGSDIRDGKKTVALSLLWDACTGDERAAVTAAAAQPSEAAVSAVLALMARHGIRHSLETEITREAETAKHLAEVLPVNGGARALLTGFTAYLTDRQS